VTRHQIVVRGLDPRIHYFGKSFVKMDCRIRSGNDGVAHVAASISPVKFEHCAERLSETFMP
jgi:hypothetical protein